MSDAARTLYLVCYDICEPKRLQRVHKYLIGYKVGGQKSFFECWLTAAELREVRDTLAELLDLSRRPRAHLPARSAHARDLLGRATAAGDRCFSDRLMARRKR
jgi:CRISPR/Cas system-associated endoribonuclease Cas2